MSDLVSGLVSVTFRALAPEAIVRAVVESGLQAIEWGGDVHVPHGNVPAAERVRRLTQDAGLVVSCYGSYFRAGESTEAEADAVVETALALGAPAIRIWAGKRSSADADAPYRAEVLGSCERLLKKVEGKPLKIVFESHDHTLTDNEVASLQVLGHLQHPQLGVGWQPPHGKPLEVCESWLRSVLPWTHHLHVFHWWPTSATRRPLSEGAERWRRYFEVGRGRVGYAMLEFVRGDSVEQLKEDAATLLALLKPA